jgi:DNA polymerase
VTDEPGADARALLGRLLRQRAELGAPPVFLQGMGRDEALKLLARAAATQRPQGSERPGRSEARPAERPPAPHRAASGAPPRSPEGTLARGADLPVLPGEHDALKDLVAGCLRCGLAGSRTQVVFNDGVANARLVVVGEAPGQNEDETGLPFVGAAGKLLDLFLMTVDLSRRESVYICNVLKCRPPGNRNPLPEEIEACRPILERQIEVVAPEVILGVGTFAAQWLTGQQAPLGKLRGKVHSHRGVPLVVTYHPAAVLRNQGWARPTWEDFQLLRQVLDRRA